MPFGPSSSRPRLTAQRGAPSWWLEKHRQEADAESRQRALRWLSGLHTREGNRRDVRVATCGRVVLAQTASGKHRWVKLTCGDRFCPACQKQRCAQLSDTLRARFRAPLDGQQPSAYLGSCFFVTLTQAQRRGESASDALDRLLDSWRAMTAKDRSVSSTEWHDFMRGAIRTVEVTRGVVGWHVHIHAVVVAKTTDVRAVRRRVFKWWAKCSPGSDSQGQDVQHLNVRKLGQLTKYITKPLAEADDLDRARAHELAYSLTGRRMMEGVGCLRSWRREGEEQLGRELDDRITAGTDVPHDAVFDVFHTLPVGRVWRLAKLDRQAHRVGAEAVRLEETQQRAWDAFWEAEAHQADEVRSVPQVVDLPRESVLPDCPGHLGQTPEVGEPTTDQLHLLGTEGL